MKKILFLLVSIVLSLSACSQDQVIEGNKVFTGDVSIEGEVVMDDSAALRSRAHMLVDSLFFTFMLGVDHPYDTALFFVGSNMGEMPTIQDSLIPRSITANSNGSFGFDIVTSSTWNDETPTIIYSGSVTAGSPTVSTTFSTAIVAPDWYVWAIIDEITLKGTLARIHFYFSEKRAY